MRYWVCSRWSVAVQFFFSLFLFLLLGRTPSVIPRPRREIPHLGQTVDPPQQKLQLAESRARGVLWDH